MRKSEMENLMAGQVVLDTRNNVELEIVGVGETKVILINGKEYSKSTLKRYFKLVEQEIPEVVEPDNTILDDIEQADELTSEQDTTADTDTTTQDTEEQTNTSDLKDTDTQDNELHEQQDTAVKKDIVEGNTDINGAEVFTNNFGVELYTNSLSGIVIKHGCKLNRMKQYIAVKNNKIRGTLIYIRVAKEGGYHFDIGKTTWNKLDTDTQVNLIEQFDACIKDRTRGLWRVSNCDSLDIFEKLLTTALDIA